MAHNVYLQVLAELGVIGELMFLALIAFCVRCAALADDASVAICDESGAISMERLATHLSIVTT